MGLRTWAGGSEKITINRSFTGRQSKRAQAVARDSRAVKLVHGCSAIGVELEGRLCYGGVAPTLPSIVG